MTAAARPTKAIRKIVIFNVFGHLNMGDAMLLEALVDLLRETFPEATIEGLAFDLKSQEQWMPDIRWHQRIATKTGSSRLRGTIVQAISLPVALAIALSRHFAFLRFLLPARQRQGLDALAEADLAISCPGGYLEDSNRAYLLNMLQVLIAARLARTVVMAPQSVGPVRSSFGQKVIASVLRRVDRAFVREQSSVDFVESLYGKLPANVVFSGDLAFWYRRPEQNIDADWRALGVDPARPIIGMTILEWSFPLAADPEAAEMAYLRALSRLVDRAIADDYQIVIFNQVSSDLKAIDKFVAINDKAIVDRGSRSCGKLARMIAQCEIFIGSRFHSCIFGLIGSVPTGAIAYLPKTTGIMKDLGLSAYVRSIDDITPEIVDALYDELLSNRATISNSVRAAVAGYRRGNGAFVDFLSDMAGDAAPNRKRTDDAVPSAEQL